MLLSSLPSECDGYIQVRVRSNSTSLRPRRPSNSRTSETSAKVCVCVQWVLHSRLPHVV